jgi:DNA-binding transcriptional MerR regulator
MITEKSVSAYKTISEVSKQIDVPSHVLRFWETKFSQVKPIKRSGGRRYYRSEDIDVLVQIRTLLYKEGYTIKGAKKALKSYLKTELIHPKIKDLTKHADDNTLENLESLSVSEKKMYSYIKALNILRDSEMRLDKLILGISK